MKFAVNYSSQLHQLLKNDSLAVDLIKCPEWDGIISQAQLLRPVYIHFDILVGNGQVYALDFQNIHRLLGQTETLHVNGHLVAPRHLDPFSKADHLKLLKIWESEITFIGKEFGMEKLALENFPFMPYHPQQALAVNAENIASIVNMMGCGLLLDLAHAKITSAVLGYNPREYIQMLPVERIVEIHITGVKRYCGYLTDHFGLSDEDWHLAAWAVDCIQSGQWNHPSLVAFEYGGVGNSFAWRSDPVVLGKQIPRLADLLKR